MNGYRPWYRREWISSWLTTASTIIVALAILFSAGSYLRDRYFSIAVLEVSPPEVVELRCSSSNFSPSECFKGNSSVYQYMSLTGAFRLSAVGPPNQEVSITGATAIVTLSTSDNNAKPERSERYRLRSFWSGDLTGGTDPRLRQVVPSSLSGGQSKGQEIWFFPLPEDCSSEGKPAECKEDQNFRVWSSFVADLGAAHDAGVTTAQIEFIFESTDGWGDSAGSVTFTCTILLGEMMQRRLERFKPKPYPPPVSEKAEVGPLTLTFPCREFLRGWNAGR